MNIKSMIEQKKKEYIKKEIFVLFSFLNDSYKEKIDNIKNLESIKFKQNSLLLELNKNCKYLELEIKYANFSGDKNIDVSFIKEDLNAKTQEIKRIKDYIVIIEEELQILGKEVFLIGKYKNDIELFIVLYDKEKPNFEKIKEAIKYYEEKKRKKFKYIY